MARLYGNENFPFPVVEGLRRLGHDALTSHAWGIQPADAQFFFSCLGEILPPGVWKMGMLGNLCRSPLCSV